MQKIIIANNCGECPFRWERVTFSGKTHLNFCKKLDRSLSELIPLPDDFPFPDDCPLKNLADIIPPEENN